MKLHLNISLNNKVYYFKMDINNLIDRKKQLTDTVDDSNEELLRYNRKTSKINEHDANVLFKKALNSQEELYEKYNTTVFIRTPFRFNK